MRIKNKKVKELLERYKEIALLAKVESILGWDLNVNLPYKAADSRAIQLAYLTKLKTEKWLDKDFKSLLASANNQKGLNEEEEAIVRNLNQSGKLFYKVPKEMIVEFSETTSRAFMAWQVARRDNKFSDFLPHLTKIVSINKIIADKLGYKDNAYDALLDQYEPGLTVEFCKKIFDKLTPSLSSILKKIQKSKSYTKEDLVAEKKLNFPKGSQRQIALYALRKMGYDFEAGRMDISAHPFTTTLDRYDVRITNRYNENDFRESLMVAMHEGGHALYEQGVNEEYTNTPLEGGVSLGIHESQSRFWENQIGRSYHFVKFITPILHAFYPDELGRTSNDEIYRMFNNVRPSLIRVEADEVTYNLHISLRFELEDALINEKIKPKDLPEIWKEKMNKYLGTEPDTDRDGVLQDVHWSYGNFGYFPTYTLGNLYAAQFTAKMKKEIDIDGLSERGDLGTILSWLRGNIHQYGSLYWPKDLSKKVTGEELNSKYFLDYINKKYSEMFKI